MHSEGQTAVVLLSGGLDSAVTLAEARREGFACHALTVDYGQRHRWELTAARRVAAALGAVEHKVLGLDLRLFGGSALTADEPVPDAREAPGAAGGVPRTYVPARNTILLSLALAWAEVLGAETIFLGANAVDYSGYPDCRPDFLEQFERLARLGTRAGREHGRFLRVRAPLLNLRKADIVRRGVDLGVDFGLTSSCYQPAADGAPCGRCEACLLRRRGFEDAGVADPRVPR